jgi:signal peptidase I
MAKRIYSLNKSHRILRHAYTLYKRKGALLDRETLKNLEQMLEDLDKAILSHNRKEADPLAKKVESFVDANFHKTIFDYTKELGIALLLALILAIFIRQMWFEIYEIPTGSMRPTFKEKDDLTATKTAFGINVPLSTSHFYFDPNLVKRTGIVILSGDKLDLQDTDSPYFGVIPYKKRYTKRLIGKPGDSLYFYGGKIYGIDRDGNEIRELLDSPWMAKLDHIPFLSFEGKLVNPTPGEIFFLQMNQPRARLTVHPTQGIQGEIYDGKKWKIDTPSKANEKHDTIDTYGDYLGINRFAMARLITPNELKERTDLQKEGLEEGLLYLELAHHPSLTFPKPELREQDIHWGLILRPQKTLIPLNQDHLQRIMKTMYTARFEIKDGFAKKYSVEKTPFTPSSPRFSDVPNGTYEFYYGKAWSIGFGGTATELDSNFPLYDSKPENVQKLFNLGIDMMTVFEPKKTGNRLFPHRYAYFRDGDLYLMGSPIILKEEETMKQYLNREEKRANESPQGKPYISFKDLGPPLKEGRIDKEFIRTFGITVPDKHYLVLGDNHAMSADSRIFGFLPEANLQGAPSFIIWPFGERWGEPPQVNYPIFTLPRIVIWTIAALCLLSFFLYHRYRRSHPYFRKINFR